MTDNEQKQAARKFAAFWKDKGYEKGQSQILNKPIKQSDGSLLNPFQQAKRYITELPLSRHPRWVVTCNFTEFYVYDMERPGGEPEKILLRTLNFERIFPAAFDF